MSGTVIAEYEPKHEDETSQIAGNLKCSSENKIKKGKNRARPRLRPRRLTSSATDSSKKDGAIFTPKTHSILPPVSDNDGAFTHFQFHKGMFEFWSCFVAVTLLAFATRLYKLDEPNHVCWDETHFGKMGSYYINRTFFFDVHPPLGKMLIGLSGWLSGYDGTFPFQKPGDKYGDTEYIGMRLFCSLLGSFIIPFCFSIVWHLSHSIPAASLAASIIIFDTGCITLSQYILLDPILMFFIIAATFSILKFKSLTCSSFTCGWWFWMASSGIFLSLAFSVKWVGLFIIILVGVMTVFDLWQLLGDMSLSKMTIAKHFFARVLCLIAIPAFVYLAIFLIHFEVLNHSGPGDGFYSSSFQSRLIGNNLYQANMPEELAYGSVITLKNQRAAGGLLHSHFHLYPEGIGARQQQVTAYTHKDDNNKWLVKRFDRNPSETDAVSYVQHGDFIRLEHLATQRNLHSHQERAPMTKRHQQVTCYGINGTGDMNDIWRVDIIGGTTGHRVKTVRTKLRLIHQITGCALHSHSKTLPKWGWEQLEVTCNPYKRDKKNIWNVEDHYNPKLPNSSFDLFAPSFLENVFESHVVMAQSNNGLKPKEGEVTSRPWQWPINYRGQRFSGVNETDIRVYLLGNPVLWWGNLCCLAGFIISFAVWAIRLQRGCNDLSQNAEQDRLVMSGCCWLFLGWALHYLPFLLMGRVLYFHHYFPAMLFNSMLSGIWIDYILQRVQSKLNANVLCSTVCSGYVALTAVILYSFYSFSPLSYGMSGPYSNKDNSSLKHLRWLESWEI